MTVRGTYTFETKVVEMQRESSTRVEKDKLGERSLPSDALYGIHADRARENFEGSGKRVHSALIRAYAQVKLAAAVVNHSLSHLDDRVFNALAQACREMIDGGLDDSIIVGALQGGAGTSLNLNVNEVLANRALQILGHAPGRYDIIHPLDHVNKQQSTNDTFMTSLKLACLALSDELEVSLTELFNSFQRKEEEFAEVVKIGRTQLQDAVPITLGREMAAYGQMIARDRWRIFKCKERLRVVNLGGTAVGTGLGAERKYIFKVVEELRRISGYGLARAEDLVEATQNTDSFVEVSGYLKTLACNLIKIAADLRLLSSGPNAGFNELDLPPRQAGSSIMPGKVNPVIPEATQQAAMMAVAYDGALSQACSMGSLELNPFGPLIADSLLSSFSLLSTGARNLARRCIDGLVAHKENCRRHAFSTTSLATVLVDELGYEAVEGLLKRSEDEGLTLEELVLKTKTMSEEKLDSIFSPSRVCRLGRPAKRK